MLSQDSPRIPPQKRLVEATAPRNPTALLSPTNTTPLPTSTPLDTLAQRNRERFHSRLSGKLCCVRYLFIPFFKYRNDHPSRLS